MADVETARKEIEKFFGDRPVPPLVFVEWKSSLPIEIELIAWGGKARAGEALEFLTPPGMKASSVFSRIAALRIHENLAVGKPPTASGPIRDRDLRNPAVKTTWKAAHDLGLAIQFNAIPRSRN